MFDNLKGIAGLAGVMKDLPRLKLKMEEVKQRLGEIVVEAETGGGAVRVKANAQLRVISIDIDDVLMASLVDSGNPDDRAMAEDLITGAVNAAHFAARILNGDKRKLLLRNKKLIVEFQEEDNEET